MFEINDAKFSLITDGFTAGTIGTRMVSGVAGYFCRGYRGTVWPCEGGEGSERPGLRLRVVTCLRIESLAKKGSLETGGIGLL